jgi:hypothetical protein
MGRFAEQLLDAITDSPLLSELLDRFFSSRLGSLFKTLVSQAINPSIIIAFMFSLVIAALPISLVLAVYRLIGRRRARVFISFQHEREPIADTLASVMAKSGIDQVKLPYMENPDHDLLLDKVRQAIRECDVFVCIPGNQPSFVESEVSMAFGLRKPLMFLLREADTSRLPNTAKKGYPVFSLEQLHRDDFCTLIKFCCYISADWRSTVRLYCSVLLHMPLCLSLLSFIYLISILVMTGTTGASANPHPINFRGPFLLQAESLLLDPPIFCFGAACLALFIILYSIFIVSRRSLRTRIRQVISAKMFSESFLPKTLDYSLSRQSRNQTS